MRQKFQRFMSGRYGYDKMGLGLIILYAVLGFIRTLFIRRKIAVYVISALMLALAVYTVYRFLSRSIYKRQRENAVFLQITGKMKSELILLKDRIRDVKTKRYRRCPACKNVLRLPVKKGRHNVRCPKCGNSFDVHIL